MSKAKDEIWKYAPLWATLLGASYTLLRNMTVRYVKKRKLTPQWTDFISAACVAAVGYVFLRYEHGQETGDS